MRASHLISLPTQTYGAGTSKTRDSKAPTYSGFLAIVPNARRHTHPSTRSTFTPKRIWAGFALFLLVAFVALLIVAIIVGISEQERAASFRSNYSLSDNHSYSDTSTCAHTYAGSLPNSRGKSIPLINGIARRFLCGSLLRVWKP